MFEECMLQRVDGAVDQVRAVINGYNLDRFGEAAGDIAYLCLDVLDDGEGVLAVALQRDTADHLAFAVELGQAAPLVRTELDPRHVPDYGARVIRALKGSAAYRGREIRFDRETGALLGGGPVDHVAVGNWR